MLDETKFLSPYGIRAISRYHQNNPYVVHVNGTQHRVDYEPAESSTGLFWAATQTGAPDLVPAQLPAHSRRVLQLEQPEDGQQRLLRRRAIVS